MAIISVAGLDPSLSNFGMCKGLLNTETGEFTDVELFLQKTSPPPKTGLRKNLEDLQRVSLLYKSLTEFTKNVDYVVAEVPVGSQSSRAAVSYGVCLALLATVDKVFIPVTPDQVKLLTVGSKTASKKQMIQWAVRMYPNANWLTARRHGVLEIINDNEHLADALATVEVFKHSEIYKGIKP